MDVSGAERLAGGQPALRGPRAGPERPEQLDRLAELLRVERAGGRRADQLLEPPLHVGGAVPERGAPLVGQQVHGDGPPTVDLAQHPVVGNAHVVVEDLGELLDAVHRLNGPDA